MSKLARSLLAAALNHQVEIFAVALQILFMLDLLLKDGERQVIPHHVYEMTTEAVLDVLAEAYEATGAGRKLAMNGFSKGW